MRSAFSNTPVSKIGSPSNARRARSFISSRRISAAISKAVGLFKRSFSPSRESLARFASAVSILVRRLITGILTIEVLANPGAEDEKLIVSSPHFICVGPRSCVAQSAPKTGRGSTWKALAKKGATSYKLDFSNSLGDLSKEAFASPRSVFPCTSITTSGKSWFGLASSCPPNSH